MKIFSLCFTGISGSGKSTLAEALYRCLHEKYNINIQIIDGDELRKELGHLFGYTKSERMKNSHVVRTLSKYMNKNKICTIISIVAPYEDMRREIREYLGENYVEVYVKCSLKECARRDVKGYYKKQKTGEMSNLNGADDVFEEPETSEIVVDTEHESIETCVEKIVSYLEDAKYVI